MEKLVLIPFDKYQRMQEGTHCPAEDKHGESSSTQSIKPAKETTISKRSVLKSRDKKKKKKQIVVAPPPPGKRDTHTDKKTDPFIDWISF